jgi:hypothetical protein
MKMMMEQMMMEQMMMEQMMNLSRNQSPNLSRNQSPNLSRNQSPETVTVMVTMEAEEMKEANQLRSHNRNYPSTPLSPFFILFAVFL